MWQIYALLTQLLGLSSWYVSKILIYIANKDLSVGNSHHILHEKFWVGTMISKQPFLIVGLEDVSHCKKNAYGAMWMFIVNFSVCIVYLTYVKNVKSQWENVDPDEGRPMLPPGMTDYVVNPEIELSEMPPYRDEVPNDDGILDTLSEDGELIDLHNETRELI